MKKLLLVIIGLAFAFSINAQTADKKWNIGLHGGATQYNGDLGNDFYKFDQAFYGFGGLSLTRLVGNRLDISLLMTKGETGYMGEIGRFRQQFTTGTINFRFNIIGAQYMFRPYIFAGGGIMMFSDLREGENNVEKFDFAAPSFGAGLNFRMGRAVVLNLQETFMYSTSDSKDHVSGGSNDFFLLHSVGLTFNFGKMSDADGDGVADRHDKCPDTPAGVVVDEFGCPIDTDGDGVPDYLDKCADTPKGVKVDAFGCPVDEDKDGVPDYLDKCPKTPAGVTVDADGCPVDTDGDGVPDYLDKCPNTPPGIQVDADGCPLDSDGDGVPDYLDKCPNTPKGAKVDEFGCEIVLKLTKEVETLFQKALQGIKFDTGKSTIKPVSFPILDAVVKVMDENPNYKLIIGGHTDNVGAEAMNMTLSKDRAESVAVYLIGKRISPERISSDGFGLTKPVDDNATAAGRTRNRRVELSVEFIEKVTVPVEK